MTMTPRRVAFCYHLCALLLVLMANVIGAAAFSCMPMPDEVIVSPVVRNGVYLVMSLGATLATPFIMLRTQLIFSNDGRKLISRMWQIALVVWLLYVSTVLAAAPVEGFAVIADGHLDNPILRWVPSLALFLMFTVGWFSVVVFHSASAQTSDEPDSPVVLIEYLHPVSLPVGDVPDDAYLEEDTDPEDDYLEDSDVDAAGAEDADSLESPNRRQRAHLRHKARVEAATIPGQKPSKETLDKLRSGICVYCGDPASHADHIRPLSRGGWNHELNLVPACEGCNSRLKRSQLLVEWMRTCPAHVLRGALMSPSVLQEFVYEMRHVETLKVVYPESSELVRRACIRHGFPELVRAQQTVDIPVTRSTPRGEVDSIPFPPVVSEYTRPDINDRIARTWLSIGERKASVSLTSRPQQELVTA